jgi:type IV secretion system protein TrbG
MRTLPFATILLASVALGACATTYKPPVISYDDMPRKAVLAPDPPKPVRSSSCRNFCPCRVS